MALDTSPSNSAPTGAAYELDDGTSVVVVTEAGATLRSFVHQGEAVLWSFGGDEPSSGGRGQVLFPWPNRLADGSYTFRDRQALAAIDEVATNCAIHGLVRYRPFELVDKTATQVTLSTKVLVEPGYPFCCSLEICYALVEGALEVRSVVRNVGELDAPFGLGFHPYLAGAPLIDEGRLELPAEIHVVADKRGIPVSGEKATDFVRDGLALAGGSGAPSNLRATVLDDCFTGLVGERDGRWRVRFYRRPDERPVIVSGDASFSHVMCFTGDTLATGLRRRGVAIEPMTCPPNALQSGTGLIVLAPGEDFRASFGIAPPN